MGVRMGVCVAEAAVHILTFAKYTVNISHVSGVCNSGSGAVVPPTTDLLHVEPCLAQLHDAPCKLRQTADWCCGQSLGGGLRFEKFMQMTLISFKNHFVVVRRYLWVESCLLIDTRHSSATRTEHRFLSLAASWSLL